MGLLDLPAELLVLIVELTRPGDLDALCLSCKTIAQAGKDVLRQHQSYKRQWMQVNLKTNQRLNHEPRTALALILAIIKDWRIAEYIEALDLRYYCDEAGVEPGIKALLEEKKNEAALEKLAADSPYPLSDLWSREGWDDDRHSGTTFAPWYYEELTTVVLLSLLPNVRTLRLPGQWRDTQYSSGEADKPTALRSVLDVIIATANNASRGEASLSRLETILPYSEAQYDPRNALDEVLPFMVLNSLKELNVCNMVGVDDGYTGIPFEWYHGDMGSSLTKIRLPGGCMDADGVAELVRHTRQLTSFAYSHYTKWHGCLHDWDAGSFIAAIGEHRGDTITDLAITVDSLFGMIENGVTSLRDFKRLHTLELDVRVFAGPSVASGHRQGMAWMFTGWSPSSVPSLTELLSPTVNKISLFVSDDEGDVEEKQGTTILRNLLGVPDKKDSDPLDLVVRSNRKDDELLEIRDLVSSLKLAQHPGWNLEFEQNDKPIWQERFIEQCGEIFE